jgi:hypothetical protein
MAGTVAVQSIGRDLESSGENSAKMACMLRRLGRIAATYVAFACILGAIATVLPRVEDTDEVSFVLFGAAGLTYFWFQFRP